jgi:hypothetical protein
MDDPTKVPDNVGGLGISSSTSFGQGDFQGSKYPTFDDVPVAPTGGGRISTVRATKIADDDDQDDDPKMAQLRQMGFTNASQNRAALIAADNNVEAAIGILLNGGITDGAFGASASSMLAASRKASDLDPHRVEDSTVQNCASCGKEFGGMVFAVKRHHCRNCGNIFCDDCSQGRAIVHLTDGTKPERVCKRCENLIALNDLDSYARYLLKLQNDKSMSDADRISVLDAMAGALKRQASRQEPKPIEQHDSKDATRTRYGTLPADLAEFECVVFFLSFSSIQIVIT